MTYLFSEEECALFSFETAPMHLTPHHHAYAFFLVINVT